MKLRRVSGDWSIKNGKGIRGGYVAGQLETSQSFLNDQEFEMILHSGACWESERTVKWKKALILECYCSFHFYPSPSWVLCPYDLEGKMFMRKQHIITRKQHHWLESERHFSKLSSPSFLTVSLYNKCSMLQLSLRPFAGLAPKHPYLIFSICVFAHSNYVCIYHCWAEITYIMLLATLFLTLARILDIFHCEGTWLDHVQFVH